MTHTTYTPNEYEQMLIAANWITAESLDSEYQEYLQKVKYLQRQFDDFEPLTYDGWKSTKEQWNRLNTEYQTEVQPHYDTHPDGNIGYKVRERESDLLRQMDWIETCLGY